MRTSRTLAVAALAAAAVGLGAPSASAWTDPSNIVVKPSVIARGGQLTVSVDGTSCSLPNSTVSSKAFPRTRLHAQPGGNTATATVKVNGSATPGAYDVTARCGEGKTLTRPSAFTVIGGVQGGLGGSSTSGATHTDMAIGGGLVGAAMLGGGVFWMRRRNEGTV